MANDISTQTEAREFPDRSLIDCPWPTLKQMREETPVFPLESQPHMVVITRHEDIRTTLRDEDPPLSSHAARTAVMGANVLLGKGTTTLPVFDTEGEEHHRKRRIAAQVVSPGRLRRYEQLIIELTDRLIDGFIDKGRIEFVQEFAGALPALVTCNMLGVPESDAEFFHEWGQLETGSLPWLDDDFKALQLDRSARMNDYLTRLVMERKDALGDDGLSMIIKSQIAIDGEFKLEECLVAAAVVLAGGVITTAHMLASMFHKLLTHPDIMARLKADSSLIGNAIEETLRLEPPVLWSPRRIVRDVEIGGCPVGGDKSVALVMFASGNRDENVFSAPNEFDIDRKNSKDHLSFGHGEHFCMGAPLARLEGRIAIERLLARLPNPRLADAPIEHVQSLQFHGLKELHVEFDKP